MEMPSLEYSQGGSCWFGKTRLVTVMPAEVRDPCLLPQRGTAQLLSLLSECGQTLVSWEGRLFSFCQKPHCSQRDTNEASAFGDSASELGSKYEFDKNTGALSSANYHKLPTGGLLGVSTCSYLK